MSETTIHNDRALPALTGLRFLAAIAVALCHFRSAGLIAFPQRVFDALDGGRTAVSLFFVLSGFVLAYNYPRLPNRTVRLKFWAARFARIYPLVLLSLAVGVVGVAYAWAHRGGGLLDKWYALSPQHAAIGLVAGFIAQITLTVGWFPFAAVNQPWNGPAWSISCEVFFYALFPLAIAWLIRRSTAGLVAVAVAGLAAQVALVVLIEQAAGVHSGFLVAQFPLVHGYEFIVGIATALIFERGGRQWLAHGKRRPSAVLVAAIAVVGLATWRPTPLAAFLPMTPVFALLIFALAGGRRGPALLASRPLILLGESSYALYLLHVPCLHALEAMGLTDMWGWLGLAGIVILTIPVFRYFETPARLRLRAYLNERISGARGGSETVGASYSD